LLDAAMRLVFMAAALVASISPLASGCAHEQTARPPTASDIARINEAAADNHWFRIEYVKPIPSRDVRVERPIGIELLAGGEIGFRTAAGEIEQLPSTMLTGVTVKDRGRGVLIGTGIGTAAVMVELAAWYWLKSAPGSCQTPDGGILSDICRSTFVKGTAAAMVLAGAGLGYLISGKGP
jgi:hypothetical protein